MNKARLHEYNPEYDEFRKRLIGLLGRAEPVELYRAKLCQIRQMPGEAITEYADRVMDTVVRAYPDAEERTKVEIANSTFVDRLSDPEIRRSIRQLKVGRTWEWTQIVELAQARTISDVTDPQGLHSFADPQAMGNRGPSRAQCGIRVKIGFGTAQMSFETFEIGRPQAGGWSAKTAAGSGTGNSATGARHTSTREEVGGSAGAARGGKIE